MIRRYFIFLSSASVRINLESFFTKDSFRLKCPYICHIVVKVFRFFSCFDLLYNKYLCMHTPLRYFFSFPYFCLSVSITNGDSFRPFTLVLFNVCKVPKFIDRTFHKRIHYTNKKTKYRVYNE